ncbi:MAG: hypothetical protein JNM89_01075 [Hyphomicrobiaceae bacterium]|nr:hypothetical protein [Hyphomicrobiaceae bacterium]
MTAPVAETCEFYVECDGVKVKVIATETPTGVEFKIDKVAGVGDLNGFFIDYDNDGGPLTKADENATNMNGSDSCTGEQFDGFDYAKQIGTPGGNDADTTSTTVVVNGITFDDLEDAQIGFRLQSVGEDREGSLKISTTFCKPHEEVKPGKIVGIKYEDCDGQLNNPGDLSGMKAAGGWTVELWKDGVKIAETTTTDDTGYYEFANLEPGEYTVKEVMQDNWYNVNVTEKTVKVEADGTVQVDFVNTEYAKLSGYKYEDCNQDGKWGEGEKGLGGWTIQLCDADGKPVLDKDGKAITAVTDSNGYYEFTGLKPGTYTTKEVLQDGWKQTDASEAAVLKSGDCDSEGNDFGNYKVPNPSMEVDKKVCSVKGGYYDESCGQWVVDSAGDCINYEIVLKNTGDVDIYNVKVEDYLENSQIDTKSMKLYGDDDKDGVLDVGETWTYKYSYKVTSADLKAAQKIVTEKTKVGFFTCYTKKCTGDLDIDNFVKVTGEAKGGVTLVKGDFETVKVACPCPNDGHNDPYGGSKAEILWNKYFGEDMVA